MSLTGKLEAKPIKRVLDNRTRELVGWLYLWDDGTEAIMWTDGPRRDVIYE